MGANITALENITPLQESLNLSVITQGNILENVKESANNVSGGWFGLLICVCIFVFMFYLIRNREGIFRYDSLKASIWASGLTFLFGIILLTFGFITNLIHVTFFGMSFLLLMLILYIRDSSSPA